MERGIVRMRVGLSYDLLRLSPCSGDLYDKPQNNKCAARNRPHPSPKTTNKTQPPNFKPCYESLRASPKLKTINCHESSRASRKRKLILFTTGLPIIFIVFTRALRPKYPGQGVRYRGYLLSCRLLVECVGWYTNTFGATPVLGLERSWLGSPRAQSWEKEFKGRRVCRGSRKFLLPGQ